MERRDWFDKIFWKGDIPRIYDNAIRQNHISKTIRANMEFKPSQTIWEGQTKMLVKQSPHHFKNIFLSYLQLFKINSKLLPLRNSTWNFLQIGTALLHLSAMRCWISACASDIRINHSMHHQSKSLFINVSDSTEIAQWTRANVSSILSRWTVLICWKTFLTCLYLFNGDEYIGRTSSQLNEVVNYAYITAQ